MKAKINGEEQSVSFRGKLFILLLLYHQSSKCQSAAFVMIEIYFRSQTYMYEKTTVKNEKLTAFVLMLDVI